MEGVRSPCRAVQRAPDLQKLVPASNQNSVPSRADFEGEFREKSDRSDGVVVAIGVDFVLGSV
jgi:hypothetical protein